jgi:hypothetical protein
MATLSEIFDSLKSRAERDKAEVETFLQEHLPVLADTVNSLASNPLAIVALKVAHLSPDFLTLIAQAIEKADTDLGAAKEAQAVADQSAADALAAASPAAEVPVGVDAESPAAA